jgi:hypothetical protein
MRRERRQYNVELEAKQVDIDQARANLVLARDKLEKTLEDFEPYEDKPEDNLTRAALLSVKAQVEEQHDAAVRLLNNLLAGANDLDVAEPRPVELAQAQLAVAQREYEMLQRPDPQDVKLAKNAWHARSSTRPRPLCATWSFKPHSMARSASCMSGKASGLRLASPCSRSPIWGTCA